MSEAGWDWNLAWLVALEHMKSDDVDELFFGYPDDRGEKDLFCACEIASMQLDGAPLEALP